MPEVPVDLIHPGGLVYVELARFVAMSAFCARRGLYGQIGVVVHGEPIAGPGKVVVLVDQANVQALRARLAVVADVFPPTSREAKESRTE